MKSVLLPLLLLSLPAFAATGSVSLTDANHLQYFFNDALTYTTTLSASGAASEASYTASVSASTVSGGTTPTKLTDAFDGYGGLVVNATPYNENGASALECGDRQIVFNTQEIGTLEVSRKVFVPTDGNFARWTNVVKNVGAATETVVLMLDNNMGSDTHTVLMASSSGDTLVDLTDSWAVSMQGVSLPAEPGTSSPDPRLGHVWQNAEGRVHADSIVFTDGDDNPQWQFTFDVAPGETAVFLSFVTGAPTWAAAQAAAEQIAGLGAGTTSCLTQAEWDSLRNFGVDCSATGDVCNTGAFDVMSGACALVPTNEGGSCDDGTDCTVDDMCLAGTCEGTPAPEDIGTEEDANCDMSVECYADADGDGFRTDESVTSDDVDCADAGEATADAPTGDCDDHDATVSPEGTEVAGDGIDQDCSGADGDRSGKSFGCSCDTSSTPQGSMLAMLMGATVLLRRKARRA